MSDLILHHYAGSPFSEKVRLVLGYKRLSWRSVDVPRIMPKPDVVALTGGYRRTPFLQIGSDIYCDTALMCRVIDRLHPDPPLYPEPSAGLADIVAQWADSALFWIAVPWTLQPAGMAHVLGPSTPESLKAFGADRAAMNPNMRRATVPDGRAAVITYLARLESMLGDGRPFLLGALASIADFAAAQSIWFIRLAPPVATVLDAYPKLGDWYGRVAGFGHGEPRPLTSTEAIEIAAAGTPAPPGFVAEPGLEPGLDVTVTPTDYAHDPVAGRLVGLDTGVVAIERTDPRAGRVRVHFPRIGFQIKPASPT